MPTFLAPEIIARSKIVPLLRGIPIKIVPEATLLSSSGAPVTSNQLHHHIHDIHKHSLQTTEEGRGHLTINTGAAPRDVPRVLGLHKAPTFVLNRIPTGLLIS